VILFGIDRPFLSLLLLVPINILVETDHFHNYCAVALLRTEGALLMGKKNGSNHFLLSNSAI
jgi:hypothetical protein